VCCEPGQHEILEGLHRCSALVLGEPAAQHMAAQRVHDLTVDQVRCTQLLLAQAARVHAPDEEIDDDTCVDDLHSPRPSRRMASVSSGSTGAPIFACASRITWRLCCTTKSALATCSSSRCRYLVSDSPRASAARASAACTSSGTSRMWITLAIRAVYR